MEEQEMEIKIIKAALDEFSEKSFAGARTESIAQRASASKSMLHYYFRTKKHLLEAVLDYMFNSVVTNYFDAYVEFIESRSELSIVDKLYLVLKFELEIITNVVKDSKLFRIMWRIFYLEDNEFIDYIKDRINQKFETIANIITEGNKSGIFSCKNPILATMRFHMSLMFFELDEKFKEINPKLNYDKADMVETVIEDFINTLMSDKKFKVNTLYSVDIKTKHDQLLSEIAKERDIRWK